MSVSFVSEICSSVIFGFDTQRSTRKIMFYYRSGNPDEVVDDCHIPLTPCEAPTNNFETSLGGTSLVSRVI